MEPGVGQGGHVARRRLDAATIGAAAPRGGNAAPAHWVHCGPLGRRSTVDTGSPGLTDLAAPAPWSRRVLRTGRVAQPPSGRHGPHFPRRSVDATPTTRGPARPTTVRTLWCCPLWTVRLRDRRAVLSPWDGTAPNPAPPPVGRCLHTAVPSAPRVDDPADPRPFPGACRDRRAVLSPLDGTAPTRRAARSGDAAPNRRVALPRGTAPDRPHCLWRSGPETAVSPSEGGGGRHGLNCRVAPSDPGAAQPGPPCRPPCLGRHGFPRPLCSVVRPGPPCRSGSFGGVGWRGVVRDHRAGRRAPAAGTVSAATVRTRQDFPSDYQAVSSTG